MTRHATPLSTATRVGLGMVAVTALGVVADIAGILTFATGNNLPDYLRTPPPSTVAGQTPSPSGGFPSNPTTASPGSSSRPASTPVDVPSPTPSPRRPLTSGAIPLSSLTPVATTGDITPDTTVRISRRDYDSSILYQCTVICDGAQGSIDYQIPDGATAFTATVGVTDDATEPEQVGTFMVYIDNRLVKTYKAALGSPKRVTVSLEKGIRIRLLAYRPGTVGNPLAQGANTAVGGSNHPPSLAWGSPAFQTGAT